MLARLSQRLAQCSTRQLFLGIFVLCTSLIIGALILQHVKGMQPCPMCIMQRYAFIAIALLALIAALHAPAKTGQRIYCGLILLAALGGLGVAIRQSWLQWFPEPSAMCGPDLSYMINSFPPGELLPMLFNGSGDCSKVDPFLGLSLANWSALSLIALIGIVIWLWRRSAAIAR